MSRLCYVLLCILFNVQGAFAQNSADITSFTLDNGMEVIVIENHRVPAVSHMLWFKIGGGDDPLGKSGLAHFHEHMMFKGTPNHPTGEYDALISQAGGEQNAFTSYDATGYYVNISKDKLALAMELEADRMRGIVPAEAEVEKEREVIIEERRSRVDNNPSALMAEQMRAALFVHHPYGTPLIGWQHEMSKLSLADVLHFHNSYHKPVNSILILSGDITEAEAKGLTKRYYGDIPKGEISVRNWAVEPMPLAARRVTMRHETVKHPSWQRVWLAPSLVYGDTEQALPLMILAQAMGGGETSYLYQELVEKQKIATSVEADYNPFSIGPEGFAIFVSPVIGVSLEAVEKAAEQALKQLMQQGLDQADIARAKTLLKAESIYAREGISGMARIMGMLRSIGLPVEYFSDWSEKIDAITPQQIQQAAQHLLSDEAHVTGTLQPAVQEQKP